MAGRDDNITIENANIMFKNFSGEEGMYNAPGDRNFSVFLDDPVADELLKKGFNVKRLLPRPGEDDNPNGQAYLQIKLGYKGRPPTVIQITSAGQVPLTQDTVAVLDWAEFITADVIFAPYEWELKDGRTGIKAYLQSLYVTIREDELAQKYAHIPIAGQAPVQQD